MCAAIYMDYNASAPLAEGAGAAVVAAMDLVGNPSSVHGPGRAARALVDRARRSVAALIGADTERLIFTSGGTEANNLALTGGGSGLCQRGRTCLRAGCGPRRPPVAGG